jgi:hypothetical protein
MADVVVKGTYFTIFSILNTSVESLTDSFKKYYFQLSQRKIVKQGPDGEILEGIDPLYGPVIVLKKGKCLVGALKFSEKKGVLTFLDSVCK